MDILKDDELLIILKLFSINERTILRGASSRFKSIIDSIKYKELIVFERTQPLAGRYQDGNHYGLDKCVYVLDLNAFFKSKPILNCMKNIKKMKIVGDVFQFNYAIIDCKFKLNQLVYLEASNVVIKSPNLIEISSKLDTLILDDVFANSSSQNFTSINSHFYCTKIAKCRIKQISLKSTTIQLVDAYFFQLCLNNGLFKEIEIIDFIGLDNLI